MSGKILVPLDGSELAERALPHVEALARATRARIVLVRAVTGGSLPVIDPPYAGAELVSEVQSYLDDVALELALHEVATERGLAEQLDPSDGDVAGWILRQVEAFEADVVVMATNGRSGLGRWLYGSVAEGILARASVPVLLVRAWDREPPALSERPTLLVPLDGSPSAEGALLPAMALAATLTGKIVLMHVVRRPQFALSPRAHSALHMARQYYDFKDDIQGYLHEIAGQLGTESVEVEVEVRVGDPVDTIIGAGGKHGAALIVMTTQGRASVGRFALGSVASGVLRQGSVPLLLVRSRMPVTDQSPSVGSLARAHPASWGDGTGAADNQQYDSKTSR